VVERIFDQGGATKLITIIVSGFASAVSDLGNLQDIDAAAAGVKSVDR
jgi:hypothetical protein